MDETDTDNSDVIDLVVQLCTRTGMIMEDAVPLALDASRKGLSERVAHLAGAVRLLMMITDAAEALLNA